MKKIFSAAVALILILSAFFIWRYLSQPNAAIKIGYIASLTGKYSDMGKTCRNGALLAVEEINDNGGVSGHKLQLVIVDDKSSPKEALVVAQNLISQNVKAIIGPLTSSNAEEIMELINSKEILTIGPVIAGDYMAKKDDYFIKMYPSTSLFGDKLGELAASKKGLKRLAIIADDSNTAYASPIIQSFTSKVTELGGKIVNHAHFNSLNNFSFSDLADSIIESHPDGLLLISAPLSTAMIIQQLRIKGSNIQCFSSSWAASQELITGGGAAVEELLLYIPFDPQSEHPDYIHFANNFNSRFSSNPNYCATFNYDAVYMLAEALTLYGKDTKKKLQKLIFENNPHKGVQGEFSVDTNGDVSNKLLLQTIKNGQFTLVEQL